MASRKRERQLAREHYERQQARREHAATKRKRTQVVATVMVALFIVSGGITALAILQNDDDPTTVATSPSESPTASASATPSDSGSATVEPTPSRTEAAGCSYQPTADAPAKDVGRPAYDPDRPNRYRRPFTATVATNQGDIVIDMAAAAAPCTTNSFRHLAESGYYDDTTCHRLTTENIFVLQCGDPTGTGSGGPGYQFGVENPPAGGSFPAGTVAMARANDPGSNGSQFFLVYEDTTLPADPGYSVFGQIAKGLDVVRKVAKAGVDGDSGDGAPSLETRITGVRIGSD